MSNDLEVDVESLRAHATRIRQIAQSGEEAVAAGKHVHAHGEAFGVLCSFIGAALEPFTLAGIGATEASVGMLNGLAKAVGETADLIETTDVQVGEFWKKVQA